ncbi:MAG: hypothetical protein ACYS47_15420 [Planctomycetota bacterium]
MYKLRGKNTCNILFLPEDVLEAAVFEALEDDFLSLDLSSVIGKAEEDLSNAPKITEKKQAEIKAKLAKVEKRLGTLLDCITPKNKELISEKMAALQEERDRLNAELLDSDAIEAEAYSSSKTVKNLVQRARDFGKLWMVATVPERKEFLSYLCESISINSEKRNATIRLHPEYVRFKEVMEEARAGSFLSTNRGDWI